MFNNKSTILDGKYTNGKYLCIPWTRNDSAQKYADKRPKSMSK